MEEGDMYCLVSCFGRFGCVCGWCGVVYDWFCYVEEY